MAQQNPQFSYKSTMISLNPVENLVELVENIEVACGNAVESMWKITTKYKNSKLLRFKVHKDLLNKNVLL